VALTSRLIGVSNYHTYPEPGEVPILSTSRSTVPKQIEKSKGPWKDEFLGIKNKFNIAKAFPGFEETQMSAKNTAAPVPDMTRLDNGLKVVSIATPDMTMSSFAFLVDAGSADEVQSTDDTINTGGITSLIDCMAFGPSTADGDDNGETVSHKLYRIGAVDQVTSNRENICYFVDVIQDNADRGLQLLAEAALHPATTQENISLAVEDLGFRSNYMMADILSRDAIAIAAYKDSPLGNYHFPTNMAQMSLHTPENIEKFRKSILYGDNCVLAAAGMRHDDLVNMAKKYFGDNSLPKKPNNVSPARRASQYTGGLYVSQRELQEPFVKLALGYEVGGYKSDNLYTMCVLEKLLGGGSSFSAGGPGKGMYTRLYLDVLNHHHWVESAQSFVAPHQENGILGIDASCKGENIQYLYQVILQEFLRLASDEVKPIELTRAKNMLKSQLMMQLESRIVVCEDIARQYATYGKRDLPEKTCEKIESVTAADIKKMVRTMLRQPPAIACIGEDVSQLPTYEQLKEFTMKKTAEVLSNSPE